MLTREPGWLKSGATPRLGDVASSEPADVAVPGSFVDFNSLLFVLHFLPHHQRCSFPCCPLSLSLQADLG